MSITVLFIGNVVSDSVLEVNECGPKHGVLIMGYAGLFHQYM